MIVNANLCHAAIKLAKLNVIIKRLDSVQSLGAIDVLCSDKTGTLTKDEITLHCVVGASNSHSDMTFRCGFLNAFFQEGLRNIIDSAILAYAESYFSAEELEKIQRMYEMVAELPFDFERRLLSVIVRDSSGDMKIITKGAADEVLRKCTHVRRDGDSLPLTVDLHHSLQRLCAEMQEKGMRVVVVATRTFVFDEKRSASTDDEYDLTFEGCLAFLDPPKEDAADAIKDLRGYGIAV
jgi:Mg2+-importing ATPase